MRQDLTEAMSKVYATSGTQQRKVTEKAISVRRELGSSRSFLSLTVRILFPMATRFIFHETIFKPGLATLFQNGSSQFPPWRKTVQQRYSCRCEKYQV